MGISPTRARTRTHTHTEAGSEGRKRQAILGHIFQVRPATRLNIHKTYLDIATDISLQLQDHQLSCNRNTSQNISDIQVSRILCYNTRISGHRSDSHRQLCNSAIPPFSGNQTKHCCVRQDRSQNTHWLMVEV